MDCIAPDVVKHEEEKETCIPDVGVFAGHSALSSVILLASDTF